MAITIYKIVLSVVLSALMKILTFNFFNCQVRLSNDFFLKNFKLDLDAQRFERRISFEN